MLKDRKPMERRRQHMKNKTLYTLSKQLPTARAIRTDYGEIELDEEMRETIDQICAKTKPECVKKDINNETI